MSTDDKRTVLAPDRLSEPPGRYSGHLPEPPDPNKLPALPYYERHPEWKPRRSPWRQTLRQRLMRSG
jgi:hypothetical protein